jgi:hypothetical protein
VYSEAVGHIGYEGNHNGAADLVQQGRIVDLDPMFHDYLRRIQVRWKDVIPYQQGKIPASYQSFTGPYEGVWWQGLGT